MTSPDPLPHDAADTTVGDRDVDVRGVTKVLAVLGVGTAVVIALMWLLTVHWREELEAKDPDISPIQRLGLAREAPGPALQSDPNAALVAFRAEEESALRSYAWVDKEKGIARIPIDRAIDLYVLSVSAPPTPAPAPPAGGEGKR